MRRFVALFVVFAATSALASQPGQPLDCEDWVFTQPGLTCRQWVPYPCPSYNGGEPRPICDAGLRRVSNNTGGVLYLTLTDANVSCNAGPALRTSIVENVGSTEQVLGYLENRCVNGSKLDATDPMPNAVVFDANAGRLLVYLRILCYGGSGCSYATGYTVFAIEGFATSFDILQSFQVPPSSIAFRSPVMPEGMRAADRFDTYWGNVTQPLDLANAHPLQCSYPQAPPNVGDYLQITAPIPTPAPGSANYVLTSVTYQGQTRAGRKASGGRLTGRDASRLPACIVE